MNLPARLCRHHQPVAGALVLGIVLAGSGIVRSSTLETAAIGAAADDDPARRALQVRELTDRLDLSHRHNLRLCAVLCRHGPTVWLPVDLAWRAAVTHEGQCRGVRIGPTHLLTEHGWRDDAGDGARRPRLPPPTPPAW